LRISEDEVKEDDELTGDGSEGDLGRFILGAEALVKGLEDGVVRGGADRGHVEG
jgi:hypothetical protein